MEHYLTNFAESKQDLYYDGFEESALQPQTVRYTMMHRMDTVVTFDPETYEEAVKVVSNDLNIDNIHELRLVQTWFWDERKSRLYIHLDAVAPLYNMVDNLELVRILVLRRA